MGARRTWLIRIEIKRHCYMTWCLRLTCCGKYYHVKYLKNTISRSGWLFKLSCSKNSEHLLNDFISGDLKEQMETGVVCPICVTPKNEWGSSQKLKLKLR